MDEGMLMKRGEEFIQTDKIWLFRLATVACRIVKEWVGWCTD
jgi:hypothetical protein